MESLIAELKPKGFIYRIPDGERKMHIVVSPEMHRVLKIYTHIKKITITEAVYNLLTTALQAELSRTKSKSESK